MKHLFISSSILRVLFPLLLFGLIAFYFNSFEFEEFAKSVEFFLKDQEYTSNMNWKAYR